MKSKAKTLVDKIINDLQQMDFKSAEESNTSLKDLLETEDQDPAVKEEVVEYMKRELESLLGSLRSLNLRVVQENMMHNFIDDITELYNIDIDISEESKAIALVDKIINDLRQKNFKSAEESNTSLMDLLETEDQDPAVKEEVVKYMKRKLERLLGGLRSLNLRVVQENMMHNFINDITELYNIDISEACKAITNDLIGGLKGVSAAEMDTIESHLDQITVKKPKEVQPKIEAPQAVRPTQDNPLSQEPPTDNEQQYDQGMINAANRFANRHKRDRDESEKILLPKLMNCNDEKTLKDIKNILKSRMGPWAKFKARMGCSRTGKILKIVDSKVRQLEDETHKQKVQKKQDGIYKSEKIIKNGTSFEL